MVIVFRFYTLTVETAGQSEQGAQLKLTGIVDAKSFREAVLNQRDAFSTGLQSPIPEFSCMEQADAGSLLSDIRDILLRIEAGINTTGDE